MFYRELSIYLHQQIFEDMRRVEFVPFRLTDVAEIFSIRIGDKRHSELQEFLIEYKDSKDTYIRNDLNEIIKSFAGIVSEGVKESFFRPEGNMNDRVCAIPVLTAYRDKKKHGTLRIYCIRISDKLLVAGGGGVKSTQTYEEDEKLHMHVQTLQDIDAELARIEMEGKEIEKEIYNLIIDID